MTRTTEVVSAGFRGRFRRFGGPGQGRWCFVLVGGYVLRKGGEALNGALS